MPQLLMFPDPRPLVERLGADFFRRAPVSPGVYLMKDAGGAVIYVGKAKNLRKRLASYRVANPNRRLRRHLRLLHSVESIELQECADERAALSRESQLLRELRPRFNRAGTWPGTPRFLCWRAEAAGLVMTVANAPVEGWHSWGPAGAGAVYLRQTLARLLWWAGHPECDSTAMPCGWFHGRLDASVVISIGCSAVSAEQMALQLKGLFNGAAPAFTGWLRERLSNRTRPFEQAILEADLENMDDFAVRLAQAVR